MADAHASVNVRVREDCLICAEAAQEGDEVLLFEHREPHRAPFFTDAGEIAWLDVDMEWAHRAHFN